jgi:hypothetical protein
MSIVSTTANYGGRVDTQQGNIKQFISSSALASWVYKKIEGLVVQTPSSSKIPVLIPSDLIVTGSIYNTSDERLKENISRINKENIDGLFTINPILFNYKSESNNNKHFGVLAQDVEKVFPELVKNNNISGYKTVNYQEFIPIIIAKMKEMQDEIDEIKQCNK